MPGIHAVWSHIGSVSPAAIIAFLVIRTAVALIRELRPLVVQLYALRGAKAHQRPTIIEALARLYAPALPPPVDEEKEPQGSEAKP